MALLGLRGKAHAIQTESAIARIQWVALARSGTQITCNRGPNHFSSRRFRWVTSRMPADSRLRLRAGRPSATATSLRTIISTWGRSSVRTMSAEMTGLKGFSVSENCPILGPIATFQRWRINSVPQHVLRTTILRAKVKRCLAESKADWMFS